jgi:Transposase DDE domain
VKVKPSREIPSDSLQNPSDPDATYDGHKGQGYQVQVMETYCTHEDEKERDKTLNLITHVEVQPACESDAHALLPALESAIERGLAPEEVLADSLYGSDDNCRKAEAMDIEIISPTMGSVKQETISLSEFRFSDRGKILSCPQGHVPVRTKHKKNRYTAAFECSDCTACPMRQGCPVKPGKKHCHLRYDDKTMRIANRRTIEHSAQFKEKYRWRAGVESTMSAYDRTTGVKRLRVRGFPAVRFCATLKAIGVNLMRATAVRKARRAGQDPAQGGRLSLQSVISVVKEHVASVWGVAKLIFSTFACPKGISQAHFAL